MWVCLRGGARSRRGRGRAGGAGRRATRIIIRDGSGLTQVTDFAIDATHPVFSRDGRHLVFAYGQPGSSASGIATLDLP